jgi:hypothetical protein
MYVSDHFNHRVRRIAAPADPQCRLMVAQRLAGGGLVLSVRCDRPVTLKAGGTITLAGTTVSLTETSATARQAGTTVLTLAVPAAVRQRLSGNRGRAQVTVRANGTSGPVTVLRTSVTIRP